MGLVLEIFLTRKNAITRYSAKIPVTQLLIKRHLSFIPIGCLRVTGIIILKINTVNHRVYLYGYIVFVGKYERKNVPTP